jgi:GNAT superfamily N-acetyltransferase
VIEADGLVTRPATPEDLPACERVWRDGLNGYLVRLGQLEVPAENPGLRRLHAHTLATDPERFRVATRGERVVAFGSAVRRGRVWFLSMLFVDPAEQARGVGRRLLAELLPGDGDVALATVADSAQPVSNGLYASLGIVPRMPLLNAVGRPRAGWSPPPLPDGITIAELRAEGTDAVDVASLDRAVLGFAHPQDHAFALRERPSAFAYRARDGQLAGYGYTSEVGRIGPIAVGDPALLGRRGRRGGPAGRPPVRGLPAPGLLDEPVRGLRALRPDLAGAALNLTGVGPKDHQPSCRRAGCPFAARRCSLGPNVAPRRARDRSQPEGRTSVRGSTDPRRAA